MAVDEAAAVVTDPDGGVQTLGEFLRARKEASGLPVTRIVEAAGISRANFYLLEKDRQRPALTTLVPLFGAMGLETRLPSEADETQVADLEVIVGEDGYMVNLKLSKEERARSRERYLSAASSGLGVALNVLDALGPGLDRSAGVRVAGPGSTGLAGGAGMLTAYAVPAVAPALAGALGMAARRIRERRAADAAEAASAPTQEDLLKDLKQTAASMPTEELEALLLTMKAMQDRPSEATQ